MVMSNMMVVGYQNQEIDTGTVVLTWLVSDLIQFYVF